ncbi:MAG: GntR family transcriptional regulator [Cyclobacteriaceae bacterium]|nr:GntR family transcriptional regulator [Cyclobacteriaceae bacterium]
MKSESLAHKAYTELRRKILSAQIPPKTRLKEDYWAKKLSVSRMAIRETLTRLLGENLVSLGPKGGYFVNSLTPEDIVQIAGDPGDWGASPGMPEAHEGAVGTA